MTDAGYFGARLQKGLLVLALFQMFLQDRYLHARVRRLTYNLLYGNEM